MASPTLQVRQTSQRDAVLGDFQLDWVRFQESDDLRKLVSDAFGTKRLRLLGQPRPTGKSWNAFFVNKSISFETAAFHDLSVLKSEPDPEVRLDGDRVKEAHVLLRGTAGEGDDEENRLGILEAEGDRGPPSLGPERHDDRQIARDRAGILESIAGAIVPVQHVRILEIDDHVMQHSLTSLTKKD